MLVCRRKRGELLVFRDAFGRLLARVELKAIRPHDVSVAIDAPDDVRIIRGELEYNGEAEDEAYRGR